jgi:hypothetical protein
MINRIDFKALAIGLLLGLVAVVVFGLLLWLTRSPAAQQGTKEELGLAEPPATSYVITAVVIGPATPTALPVPTITATTTATPTLYMVPMATATPPPEPTRIVVLGPPTVTPLPPKLEGLGGLVQGLFGSWLYKGLEGK